MTRSRTHTAGRWTPVLLLLAAGVVAVIGCGGSSHDLTQCGNGHIDSGEQCDDGNTLDSDACTAVCTLSRCGDGAVQTGVETCDGLNVGSMTCEALGYGVGPNRRSQPACLDACDGFDLSVCGPLHTPTPVRPTATATSTATPTPTLLPSTCGDGLLEPGETCTSCPADCVPASCTPSGDTISFALALPGSRTPSQAVVRLAYRSSVIGIPGSGNDTSVRQRVRAAPPLPSGFTVDDRDYAVEVTSTRSAGLPSPFVTARFDLCSGAPAPTLDDVSCTVQRCEDAAGAIPGCTCSALLP